MNKTSTVLTLKDLRKSFIQGGQELHVLKGIDLSLKEGEMVALVGASGAGKSTLLQIAGLLDTATSGEIFVGGAPCETLSDDARTYIRCHKMGFVYQFHHLLPEFSALENVMMPLLLAGQSMDGARGRAQDLLESLGLNERLHHRPSQLSGGEQQRVAILRAIANKPAILLADEPTGNLDELTAEKVFSELLELVKKHNMAALIATHSTTLAGKMDRIIHLHQGRVKA